jgi:hypothetical protein
LLLHNTLECMNSGPATSGENSQRVTVRGAWWVRVISSRHSIVPAMSGDGTQPILPSGLGLFHRGISMSFFRSVAASLKAVSPWPNFQWLEGGSPCGIFRVWPMALRQYDAGAVRVDRRTVLGVRKQFVSTISGQFRRRILALIVHGTGFWSQDKRNRGLLCGRPSSGAEKESDAGDSDQNWIRRLAAFCVFNEG